MNADEAEPSACPRCHGAGTLTVKVCCGRGCIDCVGEDLRRQIECRRCGGTGRASPAAPSRTTPHGGTRRP